jgi:glycine cleavage system aminomethyltransferase T
VTTSAAETPTIEPIRRAPMHRMHATLGARFERVGGWDVPAAYPDAAAELDALTDGIAIADVTARGKIDVQGDVDAVFTAAADDLLRVRISGSWGLLLDSPGGPVRAAELEASVGAAATVTDVTDLYAGFVLAGPRLPDLLAMLTPFDPASLEAGGAVGTMFAEVRAVLVRRDLAGEPVEAYVTSDHGRYVFDTLLTVAGHLGGRPVGWTQLHHWGWRAC